MFAKTLTLIVFLAALAGATLYYRQQRFEMMHEMARRHREIDHYRAALWDLQTRLAQEARPDRVARAVERSGLQLEPALPEPAPSPPAQVAVLAEP